MFRLKRFLLFFKLETGGFVIGWISLIVDFLAFISSLISFLILGIFGCDSFERVVNSSKIKYAGDFWKDCEKGRGILIFVLLMSSLVTAAFVFMSWLLIRGTQYRNHLHVKPAMITKGVISLLFFLSMLTLKPAGIISGAVNGIFFAYQFLVLYSLFAKFRYEKKNAPTRK